MWPTNKILGVVLSVCLAAIPAHVFAEELIVSAAASLNNVLKEIGGDFERAHPGVHVLFNFGASDALVQQVVRGAPVDILALADEVSMDKAVELKIVYPESRADFVGNVLIIAAPIKSDLQITSLNDLLSPKIHKVAIGKPDSVPVGRYAMKALVYAGLWENLRPKIIFTQNVRQSLDYIAKGEVEAGAVYVTDVAVMQDKVKTAFVVPLNAPIRYPIAIARETKVVLTAKKFIEYLFSAEGRSTFSKYGFAKP